MARGHVGGGHHMSHGFVSKAQWRYFYASKNPKLRALAHKEAHKVIAERGKVTGFRSLPTRKTVVSGRRHV